ncbi:DUF3823 domain-containing protein [Bacteroides ihuae]|uniref:DUF3823 domain-containing protein n=1 Tax=Bacteroides ihuae TaxID=1852362 RepID=UPI0008D96B6A|nr:DUF3823 domain-containing protein [Bacteroides ihuae]
MKRNILSLIIICSLLLSGCEYDNFDEPTSFLMGKVVYEGKTVGVRTNGPQLELWQDGYGLKKNIPIYIAQDGTYSVALFNGQYKMVRKAGAPWEAQLSDTIIVNVKNKTEYDVPVIPYFTITEEGFQKQGNTISAKFTINKIVSSAKIESVRLYLGSSVLTDQNKNEQAQNADIATIQIGQEATVTTTIPTNLAQLDYIFVRVGVRATVSNEYYYTQVQKIALK